MSDHDTAPRHDAAGLPNPLPTALAFVVQFGADSAPAQDLMLGRIEHVVSGRQRRFSNANELLVALQEMLTATQQEAAANG